MTGNRRRHYAKTEGGFREPPSEGTKMRAYYDMFVQNPLKLQHFNSRCDRNSCKRYLIDFHSLDIRSFTKDGKHLGYILVGMHTPAGYQDFVAEYVGT